MVTRLFILMWGILSTTPLWAITCYYTLAKDNCWLDYTVTVEVMDSATAEVLTTVTVPAGKAWVRQTFPCKPAQKLMYRAQFSPLIWENEKDKKYAAKNYWSLPATVNAGDSAWNISVCYPSAFSQVPFPPKAIHSCTCDFESIPMVAPKIIYQK